MHDERTNFVHTELAREALPYFLSPMMPGKLPIWNAEYWLAQMQINLTGFLNGKFARMFMGELWAMLDSAQNSENGIPTELLNAKMDEIKERKSEDTKMKESLRKLADSIGAEAERQERGDDERFKRRRSRSRER